MPQSNHLRTIGSVAYASGQRVTLEIDRAGVLLELAIRIAFRITNTASSPVGPLFQTLARVLRRIEVVVGGRDTVFHLSGEMLAARLAYEHGIVPFGMDAAVVLTASAATDYEIVLPLQFFIPNAQRAEDAALDLRRVSSCTLALTFANSNCSDFFTTPNNAALSNVTCEVEGNYLLDAPADAVYLARTLDMVERELTGSSDNFDISMDRGSGIFYRSFFIATDADNVGVDTILPGATGKINLEAGSFVFTKTTPNQVKARNRRQFVIAPVAGCYFLPQSLFGSGKSWINSAELTSDLKLIFNATKVTGTNKIRVAREGMRPLKLAAAA